ncbi:glycosyltransferase family 39 protein [Candidatus Woesearchaeota archaeon]|nr:glycosyltransferase family 39 protein [Candidatus Woesearchaeota archaeon]
MAEKFDKFLAIVLVASFILRLYLSLVAVPLNGVETNHPNIIRYMAHAKAIPVIMPLQPGASLYHDTPLFHMTAAALYFVFSQPGIFWGEFILKLISPVFALLTMILLYATAIRLFGSKKIGFYAVLFYAFLPLSLRLTTYMTLDTEFAFFILLSFYLLLEQRSWLAALSFGVAYNIKALALFYFPFLAYVLYHQNKDAGYRKKLLVFFLIALLFIAPWMIRNGVALHNPVYPMFNNLFDGYKHELDDSFNRGGSLGHFFYRNFPAKFFFGMFGFPEENKDIEFSFYGVSEDTVFNLIKLSDPWIVLLVNLWAMLIIVFSLPIWFGIYYLFKNAHVFSRYFLAALISGSLIHAVYIFLTSDTATRYYSPVFPLIALLWAYGLVNAIQKPFFQHNFVKKAGRLFIVGMLLGFIAVQTYETHLISFEIHKYDALFKWVNTYIPDDAYIYRVSGIVTYYTGNYYTDSVEKVRDTQGYIITQHVTDYGPSLYLPEKVPDELEVKELYSNEKMGVRVYRVVT